MYVKNGCFYLYDLLQIPFGGLEVPLLQVFVDAAQQLRAVRLRNVHAREQIRIYPSKQRHILVHQVSDNIYISKGRQKQSRPHCSTFDAINNCLV
jgi:hypothetical protein